VLLERSQLVDRALAELLGEHALHRDIDRDRRQADAAVEHCLGGLDGHGAGQLGVAHHLHEGFERLLAETARQLAHVVCSRHGNIAARSTRTAPVPDLKTR
jgi:hypothetical protein